MYDQMWLCMTMYDYVWPWMPNMTMYDYVCLCMRIYDYVWLYITMYDYIWLCMTMYEYKISTVSYTKAVIRLSSEMMWTIVYNV